MVVLFPSKKNQPVNSIYYKLMKKESEGKNPTIDFYQSIRSITALFAEKLDSSIELSQNSDLVAYSYFWWYQTSQSTDSRHNNFYCLHKDVLTVWHKNLPLTLADQKIPIEDEEQIITIKLDIIDLPLPEECEIESPMYENNDAPFEISKFVKYIIKHSIKTSCITVYFESPTNKYIYPKKEFKINGKENQNFTNQEISSWMIDTLNSSNNI